MSIKRFYYVACGVFAALFWVVLAGPSSPPIASSEPLSNTRSAPDLTATPSPGPSCVSITGSTPRCFWPDTMSYYFGLYNSCNVTLTGSGAVQLELAPTSSGPWTVYNQQTVNQSLPPGSSYTAGNFVENNIPPEYHFYRFTLVLNTSNGQTLNSTTVAMSLCNTPNTPSPTPTGITTRCFMEATGAQATCSQPDTYAYNFGIYSHCDTTMPGTVQVQLQVSANQGGPWTIYDTRTYSRSYSPGVNSVQGTFTEPYIPPQYQWYLITMSASYPGPFGNRYVTSETQPAPICTGTSTTTVTPTLSPTQTASPTPTSCPNNYNYTVSTGTIVSGTTLLPGSQCYSCIVNVALPFPFTFYGQTYTSANLSTDGNLQFTTTHLGPNTCPLPESLLGPAMMPHWDDLLDTSYHPPCQAAMGSDCGIYTSISGSAPNRIYNIQWRARFNSTSQHTANFEIRLYENSPYFEYIYGWVSYTGGNASIGVQDGGCRVTAYSCNTWNNIQPGTHIGWGAPPPPSTTTPTPTCCNNVTGTINSSCEGTSYRYTFGLTNSCSITTTGSGGLFFEVSPNSTGPWTSPLHIDYFNYQVPPGYSESSGSMWSGGLPPGNNWFRHRLYLAGSCWTVNVTSAPQPACVTGTVTPGTVPPTSTPTHTRTTTATATPCPQNYVYATATATIVPGATDIGNHCDDCLTQITLPFPYQLYDQTFTQVGLDSNGKAHFPTGVSVFPVECFPQPGITYTIFPYWDDLFTDCGGCGIYTSVSGTAPNRIFNIEWRAGYFSDGGNANFEIRLYEGQTRFDVIYGVLTQGNTGSLAGVQKDTTHFTQYFCNGQGGDANNGRLVIYTLPACETATPGPTSTPPPIATYTATVTPVAATATQIMPTSTPTACVSGADYVVATAIGTIIPRPPTGPIRGSDCGNCVVSIQFPFPYQLYGQTYTGANLSTEGNVQFIGSSTQFVNVCLPASGFDATIFPYWEDLSTDCSNCGIYAQTTGSEPNRVFHLEWYARFFSTGSTANFELRLYESSQRFDIIYGTVTQGNVSTTVGVQKDISHYTQYVCYGVGGSIARDLMLIFTLPTCPTATPPPTMTSTPVPCNLSFTDVPPDNTFYTQVRCLACRGIVSGYSDGTFRPNNQITRGQLAKMVSNAAGFSEPVSGQTFQDVPPTHTFYEFIERLTTRGYMTGYVCGGAGEPCEVGNMPYFRPFANATRGQTSKIVANAAQIETPIPPDQQTFQDVPPSHTFWLWIERLVTRNVMSGYECGRPGEPCIAPENRPYFRPGNDVTRGQSSKIVANTFFPDCQMR